jgi:transposase
MEYGAIDLHTKQSQIRIVTAEGQVVLERRIETRPEALTRVFSGRGALRILIEAGTESEWVAQHLEQAGHEVVVADPNFLPMYGMVRRVKTDRRDVAALAEANRLGHYRPAYRVSASQRALRQRLQVRRILVQVRTQLINTVRTQVRSAGLRIPAGEAEAFIARLARVPLSAPLRTTLTPLIDLLRELETPIATLDAEMAAAAQADPVVTRLMTMPGVGPITALQVRATIDDVTRFPRAGQVAAYVGLVPREASSGERQRQGHITKAGPSETRAMLVQAAWALWRTRGGPGSALRTWMQRLADRRGKRIAIVAGARRMVRILYAMWRDGQDFRGTSMTGVA